MKLSTTILPLLCATLASSKATHKLSYDSAQPAALAKVPGNNPLEFCGDPSTYMVTVESVDLNPNPPQAGKMLSISAKGHVDQEIVKGAKVQLRVKYRKLITLINAVYPLCENLDKIDIECPLEEGAVEVHKSAQLPAIIPVGDYEVFANVITEDNKEVLCMQGTVNFALHL